MSTILEEQDDDYEYLRHVQEEPKNPDAFIIPSKARIYFVQGNRGEGKSSIDEIIAEENYLAGHTIIDLHSADNFESLYWVINKNCKRFWDGWRERNKTALINGEIAEPLHCTCEKRYPMLLVVPDYVQIDQEAIDQFNGKYYTKEEWRQLGHIEGYYTTKEVNGKIVKEPPIKPDYYEWIKVKRFHIPNKGYKNRDDFVKDLTEMMLIGKDERRVITTNPAFFKSVDHKFVFLEKLLKEIGEISRSHFKPPTPLDVARMRYRTDKKIDPDKPIPYNEWTTEEKNSHRITIMIREMGSLVSSILNEEKNQVIVKKAIFKIVKIVRQYRISLIADFQRHGDIFAGVRDQRDVFIFKCTNIDMFPEAYNWLRDEIEQKNKEIAMTLGQQRADKLYPRIDSLERNQMVVLYPKKNKLGKRWKLFLVRTPYFHHHQEDDDFERETPIKKDTFLQKGTWRFIDRGQDGELVESKKDEIQQDKKMQEIQMDKLYDIANKLMNPTNPETKKMKSKEVFEHLKSLGLIPDEWKNDQALRTFMSRKRKRMNQLVA